MQREARLQVPQATVKIQQVDGRRAQRPSDRSHPFPDSRLETARTLDQSTGNVADALRGVVQNHTIVLDIEMQVLQIALRNENHLSRRLHSQRDTEFNKDALICQRQVRQEEVAE